MTENNSQTDGHSKESACPQCGAKLGFEFVSQFADKSRVSFTITPNPGELLSTKSVGGSIEALGGLFGAVGKELGVKTATLIERITTAEDGTIKVDLVLARHQPGTAKQKT